MEWRQFKKIIIEEDKVLKMVTLHTRVGKPERVCLDFGDDEYEGIGNVVYTFIDGVLKDSDGDVIEFRDVDGDDNIVEELPTKLVKYMVAIDTASEEDRSPLLTTRVGRKWAYTRPVDNPVCGEERRWDVHELLLMVHDYLRDPVPLIQVFVDDEWHPAVGVDTQSVKKGTTRFYFADGGMLDVQDVDRDHLVREPEPRPDDSLTCVDVVDDSLDECDVVVDTRVDVDDDNDHSIGDRGVDTGFDVAPKVCGLVDHCTQMIMDDGDSVCSLSGDDDDLWEP